MKLIKIKEIGKIKISFIFCTIISFVISLLVSSKYYIKRIFGMDDVYKEFIYGDTIFSYYNKSVDFYVIFMFLTLFLFLYYVISKIFIIEYKNYIEINVENKNNQFLILVGIPFLFYFVIPIFRNFDLEVLNAYFTYVFLMFSYMYKKEAKFYLEIFWNLIFLYFTSIILSQIFIKYFQIKIDIIILFSIISILVLINYKNTGSLLSQIFLPLYFIKILENDYLYNEKIISISNSLNLKIFVTLLIISISLYSIYEWKKNNKRILYFSSLAMLVFFIKWDNAPLLYSVDEYHTGELFTAYDQIYKIGSKAYSNYIPTKGYYHIIIGYLNDFFYEGNYMSINEAHNLSKFLSGLIMVFIFNLFKIKEIILIIILLNIIPDFSDYFSNYFLVIPTLLFLYQKKIFNNSYNFIISYLFLSFLNFLYYQSFGIALSLAIFPCFIYSIYKIIQNKIEISKQQIILLIFGFILMVYNFEMIKEAIRYCLLNSSSNLFYWGNSSGYSEKDKFQFLLKMLTCNFWVIIILYYIILIFKEYKKMPKRKLFINSCIVLFPIIISSYLLGRHDSGLRRTAVYTVELINLMIVYFLLIINSNKQRKKLVLLISLLISLLICYRNYFPSYSFFVNKAKAITVHKIDNSHIYYDNSDGMKIGKGFIKSEILEDLKKEYTLIKAVASKPQETFMIIDPYVTQSARYSIFNYKIPTLSHSILNISSLKSQQHEMKRFKSLDVPIIRISEGILRYQVFFKEIMLKNYIYTNYNGREYLIEKKKFQEISKNFELISKEYPNYLIQSNFGILPIKWGNGFESNKEKIEKLKIQNKITYLNEIKKENEKLITVGESDPFIIYKLDENIAGKSVDFIRIKIKYPKKFNGQLFWMNVGESFSEENSIRYVGREGNLIIPVSKNLNWLKSDQIENIRLDFDGLNKEQKIEVEKIEFFYLKN